ncbi:MAG: hypothetical protein ACOZF2_08130 [Thermodesulfobacteriota bacterium]
MRRLIIVLIFLISLLKVQPAAANLVINGGFETGNFTHWYHENMWFNVSQEYPHGGKWSALFNGWGKCVLSQAVNTLPGKYYEVSFWMAGGPFYGNNFKVYWDGGVIYNINDFWGSHYQKISAIRLAKAFTGEIKFVCGTGDNPADLNLDDIEVNLVDNLLTNSSFETGDFTGWTHEAHITDLAVCNYQHHDGSWSVYMCGTRSKGQCKISQTFATIPGQSYQVSFWREGGAENGKNYLWAYWNGTQIPSISVDPSDWNAVWYFSEVSSTQVATGTSTTLEFIYDPGNSGIAGYLDTVLVIVPRSTVTRPKHVPPVMLLLE